ncbi:MAG TPA: SusC/RagA family TonB-linked outer membrane protein, partial [Sphingobacterium sp.]|nr:SusC/RagA family TonB-linked outer membrane protein [Sphingobacterium sp.]
MKINLNLLLQKEGYFRVSHVETYIKKQFAIYFSQPLAPSTRTLTQVLMRIQVIVLLLGFCLAQANAWTYGQQITLKTEKGNLETILKELERQSGYTFFYKKNEVTQVRNMSVNLTNVSFENALETVLKKADFDFDLFGKTVVLKKVSLVAPVRVKVAPVETGAALLQQFIRGKVVDEEGKPIGGASIRLKSNTSSVIVSGEDGSFTLPLTALNEVIVVSYLGYAVKELKASLDANQMVVRLQKQEKEVDEVVITGMLNRRKETFTGSSTTYTIDELKSIGNTNVIQSLRTLDPSFLLMENNLAGSNPNTLATIELRGTTSITTDALRDEFSEDPNQPLFILDGFPTTLRVITDLDMNRIESITLLKDAASTAMYGSRASNGVVVVETIRPKANEITINYSTDVNFDFPDLRSYNMMNAAEKLEFEKLSGRYDIHPRLSKPEDQMDLDQLYAERLQTVLEGVDSYWLSDPLRNAYSQRHSLFINGGERQLSYTVGGDYRYNRGIMKGSSRDTWGTRFNVSYRGAKLNLSNQLYINGYSSNESPHGNFSKWVDTNPYFRKVDPSVTYLAAISNPYSTANTLYVENPFNSAFIGNYDRSSNYKITNNALARYDITKKLRAEASLQIEKSSTGSDEFTSPRDASFRQTAFVEKGKLTNKEVSSLSYTVNGSLVYNNVLNDKHAFNGLLRGEIHNRESASAGYTAIGFPSMSNGNPRFAYGYALNSRPQSSMVVNRRTSLVSTLNYSFDTRYNADLTYSLDGTTAFGSDNIFSSFYSVGASWNLHRENFVVEALPGLDQLRVRANYGVTGNQNFTSYTSVSTYEYISGFNAFGQGVFLNSLGNSDLEWQNTY